MDLPKDQQAALAAWLSARDEAEWDAEIERDFSPGGAGIALLEEMKADTRAGKFNPLSTAGRGSANSPRPEWHSSPLRLGGSGSYTFTSFKAGRGGVHGAHWPILPRYRLPRGRHFPLGAGSDRTKLITSFCGG
jgi:hypothetical protein